MGSSIKIKLISLKDQLNAGCVEYDTIISTIEDVFRQYHLGKIILPDKISQVFNQETQDRINCMPSTLFEQGICGVKWVSVFPGNPQKYGLPNVSGIIILSEIEKGFPFAVMDGTLITALRTAAMVFSTLLTVKNVTMVQNITTVCMADARPHVRKRHSAVMESRMVKNLLNGS